MTGEAVDDLMDQMGAGDGTSSALKEKPKCC